MKIEIIKNWAREDFENNINPKSLKDRALASYEGMDSEDRLSIEYNEFCDIYEDAFNEASKEKETKLRDKVAQLKNKKEDVSISVEDGNNMCELTNIVDDSDNFILVEDLEVYLEDDEFSDILWVTVKVLQTSGLEDVIHKSVLKEINDLVKE